MAFPSSTHSINVASQIVIGGVWVFHGVYSKLLNGIPRHRMIVGRILGRGLANSATKVIGCLETLLGIWAFSGFAPMSCALVQTVAIITMNSLEILWAPDLLISAVGMVLLNLVFLGVIWHWALSAGI